MYTDLYWDTVAEGKFKVAYGRVMLIGGPSVGKSSLKRALMGQPMIQRMDSTIMGDLQALQISGDLQAMQTSANREMGRQWIDAASKWKPITEKEEIDELALLLKLTYESSDDAQGLSMAANDLFEVPEDLANSTPDVPESEIKEIQKSSVAAKLRKAVTRIDAISEDMQPSPFVHLWDSGGQPLFREILPTFLTSRTLFILMFDASTDLNEKITTAQNYDGYHDSGEVTNVTTLDLITKWMASIHMYLAKHGETSNFPRILLVASHGDEIKDPLKVKALKHKLIEHFEGNPSADLLLHGLTENSIKIIDNTTSGTDKEDEQIGEIRQNVHDFITKELGVLTPVSWILFRKVISTEKIISLETATTIGRACKIPPEQVPRVLMFYHELGVLLFYPNIDGLRNVIITDPKWFVQQIGEVLTLHGRQSRSFPHTTWNLLQSKGILVESLYREAWKNCGFDPQSLVDLLVHFRLASEVQTDEYYIKNIKQYFIPAVLKPYDGDVQSVVMQKHHLKAAPLHITFQMKYVPPGFYTRLVTSLLTSPGLKLVFREGIYQNRVTLHYGKRARDCITITELQSVIEVIVQRFAPGEKLKPFQVVCQDLLVLLQQSCWSVNQMLLNRKQSNPEQIAFVKHQSNQGIQFAEPNLKFICLACPNEAMHYKCHCGEETSDDQLKCETNSTYRPLLPQEKFWFVSAEITDEVCNYHTCIIPSRITNVL